jgi:GntR family transcriptional repressor for pyruvate dehydrogenase complex
LLETAPADVLHARLALEPGMADLIKLHAGSGEFEAMHATLTATDGAGSWQDFEQCDKTFHRQLACATRNPMILRIAEELTRVRDHASRGQLKSGAQTAERRAVILRDQDEILDALEARDATRARLAIRIHVLHARDAMLGLGALSRARSPFHSSHCPGSPP